MYNDITLRVYNSYAGQKGKIYEEFFDLDVDSSQIDIKADISSTDIGELGKVFGMGTLSFALPSTPANDEFFSYGFDLGSQVGTTLKKHYRCQVLVDGGNVFEGFLNIENIITDNSGEGKTLYNVNISSAIPLLKEVLKDKELNDSMFDWSALEHDYTLENITSSWDGNLAGGDVVYPFVDYGYVDGIENSTYTYLNDAYGYDERSVFSGGILPYNTFKPAVRVKTILDGIFDATDLSYTSSFLGAASPFGGGISADMDDLYMLSTPNDMLGLGVLAVNDASIYSGSDFTLSSDEFAVPILPYIDTVVNSGDYDAFDITQNHFTGLVGSFEIAPKFLATYIGTAGYGFEAWFRYLVNGEVREVYHSPFSEDLVATNAKLYESVGVTLHDLVATDVVTIEITVKTKLYADAPNYATHDIVYSGFEIGVVTTAIPITNASFSGLNGYFRGMKALDFLKGIQQQFNLVLWADPEDPKLINIEPYPTFIENGNTVDWSDRVDGNESYEIEHPTKYFPKNVDFTNKKDSKDGFLTYYSENVLEADQQLGSYLITNDSDVSDGDQTIGDGFFAPTWVDPLDGTPTSRDEGEMLIIPKIRGNSGDGKKTIAFEPRLLFNLGKKTLQRTIGGITLSNYLNIVDESSNTIYVDEIPEFSPLTSNVAGADKFDINFNGAGHWYGIDHYPALGHWTQNNAYNLFYADYINNITRNEAKLVTLNVNFDPQDLYTLKLNDTVFIDGHEYIINNISGFNLLRPQSVEVELLKRVSSFGLNRRVYTINGANDPLNTGDNDGKEVYGNYTGTKGDVVQIYDFETKGQITDLTDIPYAILKDLGGSDVSGSDVVISRAAIGAPKASEETGGIRSYSVTANTITADNIEVNSLTIDGIGVLESGSTLVVSASVESASFADYAANAGTATTASHALTASYIEPEKLNDLVLSGSADAKQLKTSVVPEIDYNFPIPLVGDETPDGGYETYYAAGYFTFNPDNDTIYGADLNGNADTATYADHAGTAGNATNATNADHVEVSIASNNTNYNRPLIFSSEDVNSYPGNVIDAHLRADEELYYNQYTNILYAENFQVPSWGEFKGNATSATTATTAATASYVHVNNVDGLTTPTLDEVLTEGNTTTQDITVGDVTIDDWGSVSGSLHDLSTTTISHAATADQATLADTISVEDVFDGVERPILLGDTPLPPTGNGPTDVRYVDGITINQSSGSITATVFKGDLEGNADTATTASYAVSASEADNAQLAQIALVAGHAESSTLAASASYIQASNIDGVVDNALSASSADTAFVSKRIETSNVVADQDYSIMLIDPTEEEVKVDLDLTHNPVTNVTTFGGDLAVDGITNVSQSIFEAGQSGGTAISASYATTASYAHYSNTGFYAEYSNYGVSASLAILAHNADSASYVHISNVDGYTPGGGATPTGSLVENIAVTDDTLTITEGDGSTYDIVVNNVENANTASYVDATNIDGVVANATSASHALVADSAISATTATSSSHALVADTATTASYINVANVDGIIDDAVSASYAVTASHALVADSVVSASHALVADNAISATSASHALVADSATIATSANSASYIHINDVDGYTAPTTPTLDEVTSQGSVTTNNIEVGKTIVSSSVDDGIEVSGTGHKNWVKLTNDYGQDVRFGASYEDAVVYNDNENGEIWLVNSASNGKIGIGKAHNAVDSYTLPLISGSEGQVLALDANNDLQWTDVTVGNVESASYADVAEVANGLAGVSELEESNVFPLTFMSGSDIYKAPLSASGGSYGYGLQNGYYNPVTGVLRLNDILFPGLTYVSGTLKAARDGNLWSTSMDGNELVITNKGGYEFRTDLSQFTGSIDTGSLLTDTISVTDDTITFTAGDGTTQDVVVNNVNNANHADRVGNFNILADHLLTVLNLGVVDDTITIWDATYTPHSVTINNVNTAYTASYVSASNIDGVVANATSASYAVTSSHAIDAEWAAEALSASLAHSATSASYVHISNVDGYTPGGGATPTGSLVENIAVTDDTLTVTEGDGSTYDLVVNNVDNAISASNVDGANVYGNVANATTANKVNISTTSTSLSHNVLFTRPSTNVVSQDSGITYNPSTDALTVGGDLAIGGITDVSSSIFDAGQSGPTPTLDDVLATGNQSDREIDVQKLIVTNTSDSDPAIYVENNVAGGNAAPDITYYRNNPSPTNGSYIAEILYRGNDSNLNSTPYGIQYVIAEDVTDGNETGEYHFKMAHSGSYIYPMKYIGENAHTNDVYISDWGSVSASLHTATAGGAVDISSLVDNIGVSNDTLTVTDEDGSSYNLTINNVDNATSSSWADEAGEIRLNSTAVDDSFVIPMVLDPYNGQDAKLYYDSGWSFKYNPSNNQITAEGMYLGNYLTCDYINNAGGQVITDYVDASGGTIDVDTLNIGGASGYTLPATDGTSGQVPTTDGAGNVTWATPSGGGGSVTIASASLGSTTYEVALASGNDLYDTNLLQLRPGTSGTSTNLYLSNNSQNTVFAFEQNATTGQAGLQALDPYGDTRWFIYYQGGRTYLGNRAENGKISIVPCNVNGGGGGETETAEFKTNDIVANGGVNGDITIFKGDTQSVPVTIDTNAAASWIGFTNSTGAIGTGNWQLMGANGDDMAIRTDVTGGKVQLIGDSGVEIKNSNTATDGYVLPSTDGTSGQQLQTDGAGNVTWATPSGGGGGGSTEVIMATSQATYYAHASSADNYYLFTGASTGGNNYYYWNKNSSTLPSSNGYQFARCGHHLGHPAYLDHTQTFNITSKGSLGGCRTTTSGWTEATEYRNKQCTVNLYHLSTNLHDASSQWTRLDYHTFTMNGSNARLARQWELSYTGTLPNYGNDSYLLLVFQFSGLNIGGTKYFDINYNLQATV